jgi:starch synthase
MKTKLRVLQVSSEVAPFSSTGGLGEVVGSLPRALARLEVDVSVVSPRYRTIDPARHHFARRLRPLDVPLGTHGVLRVTVYEGTLPGGTVPVYLIDHPLYDRDGLYRQGDDDYVDNGLRFALLSAAALELSRAAGKPPDVVHAHDWQAGLATYWAKRDVRPSPATVFTIHNLTFPGLMNKSLVDELGLGWDVFVPDQAEYYDQLSYLKLGIARADRVTTVSPRYAKEILTPEHGVGLDGFLRDRKDRLVGILNGISYEQWSPDKDPYLPVCYDAADPSGKMACKAALQRELGLPVRARTPLVGSISRLTEQKGIDWITAAGEELARLDAQYVFLGSGDKRFENALQNLARRYPMKVAVRLGFDEALSHRIEAGADLFLMPSRFEPCGLNQLYSLRYGTLPLVRATGGLDDTVVDFDEKSGTGTGFKFEEGSATALVATVKRALSIYQHQETWRRLVMHIMKLDYGWEASARRYLEVYESALATRRTERQSA